MRTTDELKEYADQYVEHDHDDQPDIWSNPDVPAFEEIIEQTGTVTFDCPYEKPGPMAGPPGSACPNDFEISLGDDAESNAERLVQIVEDANGTLRCDECGEPIFGFRGDGDHE